MYHVTSLLKTLQWLPVPSELSLQPSLGSTRLGPGALALLILSTPLYLTYALLQLQ